MESLAQASAGGIAAVVATITIYPVIVIKTRLQAQKKSKSLKTIKYSSPIDCFFKIIKHEGILSLYKGIQSNLPKAFFTNFIFYFAYALFKPLFKANNFISNVLHGILAGIVVQLAITPVDFINTKLILNQSAGSKSLATKDTFFSLFLEILKKPNGFFEFYRGIKPQLFLTVNPGITNVVRSNLEHLAQTAGKNVSSKRNGGKDFLIGAVSKLIAATLTYPLVVSKIYMYTLSDKQEKLGLIQVLTNIFEAEGFRGLYKGLQAQLVGAVLKEAFMNMYRKEIYTIVISLFKRKVTRIK